MGNIQSSINSTISGIAHLKQMDNIANAASGPKGLTAAQAKTKAKQSLDDAKESRNYKAEAIANLGKGFHSDNEIEDEIKRIKGGTN